MAKKQKKVRKNVTRGIAYVKSTFNNTQITINDVARSAGVSRQTVSRALNDAPDIGQATKERVRLDTETVTEERQVSEEVRKEQIDADGDVR